jgi:hypothetical protein
MNIGGPVGSTIPQAPATSMTELQQRAVVNVADAEKYNVRSWITSASKLYSQVTYGTCCQITQLLAHFSLFLFAG